jgi:DNA-binding NtrC family response regulator
VRNGKAVLLIIDDEPLICEVLKDLVLGMTQKLTVLTATSVREALVLIPTADLIISDIQMPDQHLLDQALKKVMSEKPIARMSGVTRGRTNFMIEKPFRAEQISEALQLLYSFHRMKESEAA